MMHLAVGTWRLLLDPPLIFLGGLYANQVDEGGPTHQGARLLTRLMPSLVVGKCGANFE